MTAPSTPLHVAHVKGTVKGEHTADLGPHTLLVGSAGRGKTTTINLVELALSGFASDLNKREATSSEAQLVAYLGTPGEPLHAVATLSDGRSAAYRIERNGPDKVKKAQHAPVPDLKIIYPWEEAIGALLTADRASSFVLRHAGEKITLDVVLDRLPSISRDLAATVLGALGSANPGTDVLGLLPMAAAHVRERLRAVRAEAKGAKSVLVAQGADAAGASPPTKEQIAALDAEEEAIIAQGQALVYPKAPEAPARPAVPTPDEARALYNAAIAARDNAAEAAQTANNHRAHVTALEAQVPAQPKTSPTVDLFSALVTLLDAYINEAQREGGALAVHAASKPCPLCAGALVLDASATARRDGYAAQREAHLQAHAAAEAAWKQAAQGLFAARAAAEEAGRYSAELAAQAERAAAAYNRAYAALSAVPAEDPAVAQAYAVAVEQHRQDYAAVEAQAAGLREQLRGVRARRTALIQAQAAWGAAAAARDKVASLEAEEEGLERLGGHIAEVRQTLTTDLRASFAKRVQAYLPAGYTFGMTPTGDAFGLERGGHLQLGLSGAERNIVALALCALIAEDEIDAANAAADAADAASAASAARTVLPIIIPEERAYDVATLGAMMRALAGVHAQVILTAPTAPKGRTPAGWTVVTVGASAGGAEAAEA